MPVVEVVQEGELSIEQLAMGVEGDTNVGVMDNGDGEVPLPASALRGSKGEPIAESTVEKPKDLVVPTPIRRNSRAEARDVLASYSREEHVRLLLTVPDRHFAWFRLRDPSLPASVREALLEFRRQDIANAYSSLISRLAQVADGDPQILWIVPAITLTARVEKAEEILTWADPFEAHVDENRDVTFGSYNGLEVRSWMRDTDLISNGYVGDNGGRMGGKVRLGVCDDTNLAWNHYGFRAAAGGSRWISFNTCTEAVCSYYTPTQTDSHGTVVAATAAGSIEGGQDPAISYPTDRVKRSGVSSKADLYYYSGGNGSSGTQIAMLQRAVTQGLDIVNHSHNWPICSACDPACDGYGMAQMISNAKQAGVVNVSCLGNLGDLNSCSAWYPAAWRDGLAVAALDSASGSNYDTLGMWFGSNVGGMNLTVNGTTYSRVVSLTDLSGPGCRLNLYDAANGYSKAACGTSIAAPAVAGSLALLKDALISLGHTAMHDGGLLMTQMLLTGDGWSHYAGTKTTTGFDKRSGAGRVHMWYPSSADLTAPWGWGCHAFDMGPATPPKTFTVGSSAPESTSITQWKLAMTFTEPTLTDAADIDVSVYNTCPPGGGSVLVAQDTSRDIRSRIRLLSTSIGNKCLEYRVSVFHMPADQTRRVFVCDYFHSGNTADH